MISSIDTTKVTHDNDVDLAKNDALTTTTHTFNYNLNEEKTKRKLFDGAMRPHYQREEKEGCVNLIFNDGAYNAVVLKALVELKNGPKHFIIGKEEVERVAVDPRKELSGKHVDTKIEFKVNKQKILIHAYNSTQKLTIQGKKYKWFVDSYLEPFLKARITNSLPQIEQINLSVRACLNTKNQTNHPDFDTLDENVEIMICDKCSFETKNATDLREHIPKYHTENLFQGLELQSTEFANSTKENNEQF